VALRRMNLRDFVIVHELELDLQAGFTVLTGETGAGKSILIDALQLALGSRAEAGVVREGAVRTEISAEFDTPSWLGDWLAEAGFKDTNAADSNASDSDTLLIRRTVDTQGKSRAWINGSAATMGQLREVADHLVDIHGQHAWAALTRTDEVRGLLDAYGKINSKDVASAYSAWKAALKTLTDARAAQASLDTERERLDWQIGELQKLAPAAHEWEGLNAEHGTLSNAQELLDAAHQAIDALEGDDKGVTSQIAKAQQLLQNQALLVQDFKALSELLLQSLAQVEDVVHSLHSYTRNTEPDPQRLAQLDDRLTLWITLARRYKRAPAELPTLLTGWKAELAQLEAASDIAALEAAERKAHAALAAACKTLTTQRRKAAPLLGSAITQAMQGLGMQGGKFEVALTALNEPAMHGAESIEFLVAGHAGSTPRPVGKVASGGELSRIALAIAVTTSQLGKAQTLIFDEVDSGVGGAVAETVGRLMKQLGKDRQVMAVTHLPQVAACADHHLLVAKQLKNQQTASQVHAIAGEQRVAEIGRMLGGEKLSGTTMAHAKEMLEQKKTTPQ
jgi:DNA repair protein RecN (Recombination protein N)